jgi:uncharacterized protein (TIGR02646 family)
MIFVERIEKPAILANNEAMWRDAYLSARRRQDMASTPVEQKEAKAARKKAEGKYNHAQVKSALQTMFSGGKCAYCESHIEHIGYSQIEHFRPKDSFPELCFDWDNLLLACGKCNGKSFKGAKFPTTPEGEFLVNPCVDHPEDFFDFRFEEDESAEEGFIAVVRPKNPRGAITEETLGLNRIQLLKKRTQTLLPYYLKLARLAGEGDEEALQLLRRAANPRFEYSAFARALLTSLTAS